jgi:hypothetical protein
MPASTARAVLETRSLRWSSPLLFNDPFDVPRQLSFGITPQQLVEASARYIAQLIQQQPTDTSHLSPKLRLIIETVKKGISPEVQKLLLAGLEEDIPKPTPTSESMDELRVMWSRSVPEMRILCLTESPTHAAMWYHYANRYAGVVIELRCNEHTDSPWLIARPVDYPEDKPAIYTAEGWAELLALDINVAVARLLDVATYTKSRDWAYEKEWRMVTFKRSNDSGHFTDYPFHSDDLVAIYLGPLISNDDKNELLRRLATFPRARAFSVSLTHSRDFVFCEAGG